MTKISLPWMEKIRGRLAEYEDDMDEGRKPKTFKYELDLILQFLEPIIEYGEQQEALIPKLMKESKKEWIKEFDKK